MRNKQDLRRSENDLKIDEILEKSNIDDFDFSEALICKPNPKFKSTVPTSIRFSKCDIELAKMIGKIKGIGYQTLLKMYIREGLNRDRKIL